VRPAGLPRLSDFDIASDWILRPVPPFPLPEEITPALVSERLAAFRASERHPLVLTREDRTSEIDLKPIVRTFGVNPDGISITIIQGTGKGVRPVEAAASCWGCLCPRGNPSEKGVGGADPPPRVAHAEGEQLIVVNAAPYETRVATLESGSSWNC